MKNLLVAFLFLFLASPCTWAREDRTSLKDLAVTEMYRYGEALYERRDYKEAGRVFLRIVHLQPDHPQAIRYLEKLGLKAPATIPVAVETPQTPLVYIDNNDPNADLKREIAAEDAAILQLNTELNDLRIQAEKSSHE